MQTKLTLRLEAPLIISAKQYAEQAGKSLSQVVADYFQSLNQKTRVSKKETLPPITRSLKGILKTKSRDDKMTYRLYLEQKHL